MDSNEIAEWVSIRFKVRKIDKNILSLNPIDFVIGNYEITLDEFIDENGNHYNDISDVAGHDPKKVSAKFFGFPCKIEKLVKKYGYNITGDCCGIDELYNDYYNDVSTYEYMCYVNDENIQKQSKNICICADDEKYIVDMYKDFFIAFDTKKIYVNHRNGNNNSISLFDRKKVIEYIKDRVKGQDEQVEQLVNTIYINQKYSDYEGLKSHILLIGPPGTGKTLMIEMLSKIADIPFVKKIATNYTSTGFVGLDVKDLLYDLYKAADKDLAKAEHGIIFLDEFDKLSGSDEKTSVRKRDVQDELLGLLDNNTYTIGGKKSNLSYGDNETVEIDTKGITFILGGAYSKITGKNVTHRKALGFNSVELNEKTKEFDTEALVEYGTEQELLRRLTVRICTNSLNKDNMKEILLDSKISNLRLFERALKEVDNVTLVYDDNTINSMIDCAIRFKGGASGIKNVVTNTLMPAIGKITDLDGNDADLIITSETVENPNNYKILKKVKNELSESNG